MEINLCSLKTSYDLARVTDARQLGQMLQSNKQLQIIKTDNDKIY
jgi:hypothetical protein